MAEAAREPALLGVLDRRVRYWTDGLVIGSRLFMRNVMSDVLPAAAVIRHRPGPPAVTAAAAIGKQDLAACPAPGFELRAWRRLRIQQV